MTFLSEKYLGQDNNKKTIDFYYDPYDSTFKNLTVIRYVWYLVNISLLLLDKFRLSVSII